MYVWYKYQGNKNTITNNDNTDNDSTKPDDDDNVVNDEYNIYWSAFCPIDAKCWAPCDKYYYYYCFVFVCLFVFTTNDFPYTAYLNLNTLQSKCYKATYS